MWAKIELNAENANRVSDEHLLQGFHSGEKIGLVGYVMSKLHLVLLQVCSRLADQTFGIDVETGLQRLRQRNAILVDESKGD